MSYAKTSQVSVQKSMNEIVSLLEKRGATDYLTGKLEGQYGIGFVYKGLPVRLKTPPVDPTGLTEKQIEQKHRTAWRVMLLWVKGQLEAIDAKLLTPQQAFLVHVQTKTGETVGDIVEREGVQAASSMVMALPAPEAAQ